MSAPRVAIVGAGPAGSSLALRLARRGVGVDLIEKEPFPRQKPCGEGLMPKSLEDLAELGVGGAAEKSGRRFHGIAYVAGTDRAEARFPERPGRMSHGLGLPRGELDMLLLEAACDHPGVRFHAETRVNGFRSREGRVQAVLTDRGELPCRALVGADGRASLVRRRAGLDAPPPGRPRGALVGTLEVDGPLPEVVEVHLVEGAEVYLTPTGLGRVQVVVCLEAAEMKAAAGDGPGRFVRALESGPGTAALWARSRLLDGVRGVGRLHAGAAAPARDGVYLAGDAAGFLDPVTGEGTSLALHDTRHLAPVLAELAAGAEPVACQAAYARAIAPERRQVAALTHLVLAALRVPALARFAVRRLARRPALLNRLVAVAAGLGEFSEVRAGELLGVLVP